MNVCAVVGAQFGSEGKGLVVSKIAKEFKHHVRVGAANAGHTLYTNHIRPGQWDKHVMQQIPCAAYANPNAELYIGPGALISPDIFCHELVTLRRWRREMGLPEKKVIVDYRAHVITESHVNREQLSDLADRIGSTSATAKEGIGVAQAARVMREEGCCTVRETKIANWSAVRLADVPKELSRADDILLEGTQGTGLSLTTGFFPYTTSRNTTAAGLAADCGVAPGRINRVIAVARTFPIRVAGNSGPFYPDSHEVTWHALGIDEENERTTVTKKVRRVATLSIEQLVDACEINGASEIALTFTDYVDTRIADADSSKSGKWMSLGAYEDLDALIRTIEFRTQTTVTMLGTGPRSLVHLDLCDHEF